MKTIDQTARAAIMNYAKDWLTGTKKEIEYTSAYRYYRDEVREQFPDMTDEEFAAMYRIMKHSSGQVCHASRSTWSVAAYLDEVGMILDGMESLNAGVNNPVSVTDAATRGGVTAAAESVNRTTRQLFHRLAQAGYLYELEISTCGKVTIRLYGIK